MNRLALTLLVAACSLCAQESAKTTPPRDPKPPLLFREDWNGAPADSERPLAQIDLRNQNLELKFYGATKQSTQPETGLWRIQHAQPTVDPTYVWTALCTSSCAVALRDRNNYMDLSGFASIRWRTKQAGFHMLRPVVKLADGTWLVADYAEGYSYNWRDSEFSPSALRWRHLNIDLVVEMLGNKQRQFIVGNDEWVENPDLTRVDEIGFTDLMPGSGRRAGGASRISPIEVYARPVKR